LSTSDFENTANAVAKQISFTERLGRGDSKEPNSEAKDQVAGRGAYKPYGFLPTGIGETCEVSRWVEGTKISEGIEFQYRFLMQVGYVGDEQLKLFLPDCIVVIDGEHLRDLRKKIARRQCTFIQQYSSKVWPALPQQTEPIIKKIEVVRPELSSKQTK
jgi:hypothetical protein